MSEAAKTKTDELPAGVEIIGPVRESGYVGYKVLIDGNRVATTRTRRAALEFIARECGLR